MTDKTKYSNISVSKETYSLLQKLSKEILPGDVPLSISKTVTYLVNSKIKEVSFNNLKDECRGKKKTSDIEYKEMGLQNYMKDLFPEQARTVFKCRSKTLDLKTHLTYKYDDNKRCRVCGTADETLEHIVNCCEDEELVLDVDQCNHKMNTIRCLNRINNFLQKVSPKQENETSNPLSCGP